MLQLFHLSVAKVDLDVRVEETTLGGPAAAAPWCGKDEGREHRSSGGGMPWRIGQDGEWDGRGTSDGMGSWIWDAGMGATSVGAQAREL
jgi:hypothetical protein